MTQHYKYGGTLSSEIRPEKGRVETVKVFYWVSFAKVSFRLLLRKKGNQGTT